MLHEFLWGFQQVQSIERYSSDMGPHTAVIAALVQLGFAPTFNPHMTAINLLIEAAMQA